MSSVISPIQQKILAVLISLVLIWLLAGTMIVPTFSYFLDRSDNIKMLEMRAARYLRSIDQEPLYRKQLEELNTAHVGDLFYHSETVEELNNQLQKDIRDLFSMINIRISDMRSNPISEEDGLQRISLRMSTNIRMEQLPQLLKDIRAHNKFIEFSDISIRTDRRQERNQPQAIDIEWDVIGLGVLDGEEGET